MLLIAAQNTARMQKRGDKDVEVFDDENVRQSFRLVMMIGGYWERFGMKLDMSDYPNPDPRELKVWEQRLVLEVVFAANGLPMGSGVTLRGNIQCLSLYRFGS